MRALHLEQKDAVSKHPELSEYLRPDPKSGWPLLNFMTVPRSTLCQCGVVCRASSFNYAEGCVIEIYEEFFEHPESLYEVLHKLLLAQYEMCTSSDSTVSVFLGLSSRLLTVLNISDIRKHVQLEEKRSLLDSSIVIPATEGDILLFVKGDSEDICSSATSKIILESFQCSIPITSPPSANGNGYEIQFTCVYGQINITKCKAYDGGGKDLTGFLDGTMNCDQTLRTCVDVALTNIGSSYCYAGKFIHNLLKFKSLSTEKKNAIIGRNFDVVCPQLSNDGRLENPRRGNGVFDTKAHVFRSWGNMLRHAMPFYNSNLVTNTQPCEYSFEGSDNSRCGLFFVATTNDISEIENSLKRMSGHFAVESDGGYGTIDNLFTITTPETGSYFYIPSLQELIDMIKYLESTGIDVRDRHISDKTCVNSSESINEIINQLPDELKNICSIDDTKVSQRISNCPKRSIIYVWCDNCKSEQSCIYEENSLLRQCMLCKWVSSIDQIRIDKST
jgi:Dyp-type peroxidase family